MTVHGTESSEEEHSDYAREVERSRYPAEEQKGNAVPPRYVTDEENFREREKEDPATMDSISSFLETMHSKNLTLKKLVKAQQQRIEDLTRENMALRQYTEMQDGEIRTTKAHLKMLRNGARDAVPHEDGSTLDDNKSPSNVSISSRHEHSKGSKDPVSPSEGSPSSKKTPTADRRKSSIMMSHKVAVRRVMHLVKKINGACNKRSVCLYPFACCIAQAALLQLLGLS